MGVLGVRYWWTRNLAFNAGSRSAAGGGRDAGQPSTPTSASARRRSVAVAGNWRHLSMSASPELAFVWFHPGGDTPSSDD